MKANSKAFLVLLLGTLSAFGPFVLDLYLPALPDLAEYFATHTSMTQLSLTSAMLGLSVGQLLLGPISDKFGRKKPLMISLAIYIISSFLLIYSPNIESFIVLRTIQGLSAAGSVVISRAVVTDLYHGKEMTRFFGLLMTVNGMAPILSPILGSFLLKYIDWQGIFAFLTLIGVVLFVICFRLNESLIEQKRLTTSTFASFTVFGKIFRNPLFMTYVLMQSIAFAAMFAYISASPFILQSHYQLSAFAFSLCFAANGTALLLGSNFGSRISNKQALYWGALGILCSCIYLTIALIGQINVWLVELGLFTLLLFIGFILPAISALAMDNEREQAGSASALLGFFPFFAGAIVSPLVGLGNIFYSTATAMLLSGVLTFVIYLRVKKDIKD
ncbi:multidrug effflux MFS transporter [Volucribacter amazonae]|uniref:Bcr/CflA family efflux transporter n=1 Tax=Volucribacter amazonae TaxID=256731 RepID=A0A9X4SMB5_9PAST|nr:multidrug effflux MFS transporter [Volucribacter amazonae]MDG6895933.1 Bcr/CflA family drug resistance efflux transporter [Volucribacter amazonae]